ncbi:MAG: hypothetical protein ACAH17_02250, partial [Candidatus Paceibacterota bacterium]
AVRGTKFAVKYDNKTKLTKVAVTEHKVFVAHTKEGQGTTTKDILENTTVNEGDTASLKSGDKPIDIKKTETDTDMKLWIEANKGKDALEVNLKDENKSKEEIRTEVIKSFTDEKKDTTRVETKETTTDTPKKTETPETKKDPVVETKPKPVVPPLDKRITSEEVFFDTFNAKFFDYLYLDDNDTPCTSRLSATEKVKELSTYATESGYPFSSVTLVDFAQSVDAYCKNKDASVKLKLQARFDVEFPYQENI